jgi:hypothetical protein
MILETIALLVVVVSIVLQNPSDILDQSQFTSTMNGISGSPLSQVQDDVDPSSEDTNRHQDGPSQGFAARGAMNFVRQPPITANESHTTDCPPTEQKRIDAFLAGADFCEVTSR